MTKITTSWDDGDILDLRVASLLDTYGIKGTFYIADTYREKRLTDNDIRMLSERHEIGAHTLTHPKLSKISREKQKEEIEGSKKWLEGILGKEIDMFCYPSGNYDENGARIAKEAGFSGARTTIMGTVDVGKPFEMTTTLSVYPMPLRKSGPNSLYWRRLFEPVSQRGGMFRKLGVPVWSMRSFEALAKKCFDIAEERDGVFHLWGHSWEIEKYDMWDELERVLSYIGDRQDCTYVTNAELL